MAKDFEKQFVLYINYKYIEFISLTINGCESQEPETKQF